METHILGMPSQANGVLVCAVVKDDQIAVQFIVLCWLLWVFWRVCIFIFFCIEIHENRAEEDSWDLGLFILSWDAPWHFQAASQLADFHFLRFQSC